MWREIAPGVYDGVPGSAPVDEQVDMLLRISGVPPATRLTHRFARWVSRKGLAGGLPAARALADGRAGHPFLALVGPPGVGKTHLTLAIAWEFLEAGMVVAYWQVEGFLDSLRQGFVMFQRGHLSDTGTPEPYRTLNFAKRCALLVLDDMGAHRETEWATAKLDEVVDHRYVNRLATVVTTNDLAQLSPRVLDRLREGRVVVLQGESQRGRQRSKEAPEIQEV